MLHLPLVALGLIVMPGAAEPVDPADRTSAEAEYRLFLDSNGIVYGDISVACAIAQTVGDPNAAMVGICYANNEDPGVIYHGAASLDGSTWTFLALEGDTTTAPSAAAGPATTFGDGTWIVGTDIAPGAYRAPGGSLCYWARLADFSGEEIIANAFSDTSSQMLVEIEASDVAFETNGCGTWEPVG